MNHSLDAESAIKQVSKSKFMHERVKQHCLLSAVLFSMISTPYMRQLEIIEHEILQVLAIP